MANEGTGGLQGDRLNQALTFFWIPDQVRDDGQGQGQGLREALIQHPNNQ